MLSHGSEAPGRSNGRRGTEAAVRLPDIDRYLDRVAPTPLVPVRLDADAPVIWCKLEFMNPSGSTKDRIAAFILGKALRRGEFAPGGTVVEASSGSTSIAMALASAQLGLRFVAVMPEGVSRERRHDHRGLWRPGRVHAGRRGHHRCAGRRGPRGRGAGRLPAAPVLQPRQPPGPPSADGAGGHRADPRGLHRRGRQRGGNRRNPGRTVGGFHRPRLRRRRRSPPDRSPAWAWTAPSAARSAAGSPASPTACRRSTPRSSRGRASSSTCPTARPSRSRGA